MKIGETYWRTSPIGDKSMVTIETQEEKEYQEVLEKEGFEFQLQQVYTPNIRKVHVGGAVCESCEG